MVNIDQCEDLIAFGTVIKGDSDISGIGVLIAFTLSAYITFSITLGAYLFGQVERRLLNRVDIHILRIKPSSPDRHRRVKIACKHSILAFSDQQIVTGIAIMAAGFHGLSVNNISVYHFHIVLYLAWMSSSVHLSALGYLRAFLSRNKSLLIWRIVGMLVLMALLIVGFVPTISNDWGLQNPWNSTDPNLTGWGVPARCFFGETYGDGINPDAVLAFILLVVSYMWKAGGQFGFIRSNYNRYVRVPVEFALETSLAYPAKRYARSKGRQRIFWLCVFRFVLALYIPIDAVIEVSASFSANLWLSALGLLYGTMQIYIPRSQVLYMTASTEQGWGFGQLTPLILLIQPIGSILEHVGSAHEDHEAPARTDQLTPTQEEKGEGPIERQHREYGETLLHFLADFKPTPVSQRSSEPSDLYPFLFDSKLFAMQVWMVHGSIIGTSVTVFYFDSSTIGNATSENWSSILFFIAGFWGFTVLAMMALAPFSRLGARKSSLFPGPSLGSGPYQVRVLARERVQSSMFSEKYP